MAWHVSDPKRRPEPCVHPFPEIGRRILSASGTVSYIHTVVLKNKGTPKRDLLAHLLSEIYIPTYHIIPFIHPSSKLHNPPLLFFLSPSITNFTPPSLCRALSAIHIHSNDSAPNHTTSMHRTRTAQITRRRAAHLACDVRRRLCCNQPGGERS